MLSIYKQLQICRQPVHEQAGKGSLGEDLCGFGVVGRYEVPAIVGACESELGIADIVCDDEVGVLFLKL